MRLATEHPSRLLHSQTGWRLPNQRQKLMLLVFHIQFPGDGTNQIATAQFEIENTGKRAGAEVAQLYVHENNPRLPRPEKELKGFKKVFLQPGEKQTVSIPLTCSAFAHYDPARKGWVPMPIFYFCGLSVTSTTSFSRRSNCCSNFPSRPIFTVRTSAGAPLFSDLILATCALVSCAGAPKSR